MAKDPVQRFQEFLRRTGRNVTQARLKVLRAVLSHHGHFDASDIWASLRREHVSMATVYRTLELLEEAGLVRKVRLGDARAHYEHTLAGGDHGHLVCRNCGKVIEFPVERLRAILEESAAKYGFRVEKVLVQAVGLCDKCS